MNNISLAQIIQVTLLGQAGFRFQCGKTTLYIDPYLSNSVEKAEGPDFRRLVPIWKDPSLCADADLVLITHAHLDHCDIDTLLPLSQASTQCQFVGPTDVRDILNVHGIANERIVRANNQWLEVDENLRIHPIVAAHPKIEFDGDGSSRYVGYVIEYCGRRIYHSGDTLLNSQVIDHIKAFSPIDVAILPVNESNFQRAARGIIGNMSVREAFQFAADLKVEALVPMHWDMFSFNSVFPEEIEVYYRLSKPPFRLLMNPTRI